MPGDKARSPGYEASLVLVKCLGTRLVGLGMRIVLYWSSAWGQGEQVQDFLVFAGMTIQISTCEHGQLLWYTRVAYCRFVSHAVHICYMLYITYCTHVLHTVHIGGHTVHLLPHLTTLCYSTGVHWEAFSVLQSHPHTLHLKKLE